MINLTTAVCVISVLISSCLSKEVTVRHPVDVLQVQNLLIRDHNGPFDSAALIFFKNVEKLALIKNNFSSFHLGFLQNLPNLQILEVTENFMEKVDYNIGKCCDELTTLEMYKSGIPEIENNFLKQMGSLESLKILSLRTENINILHKGTIVNPHLEYLIIKEGKLSRIEDGALEKLRNLKHLDLSLNYLTAIKPETFKGLDDLKTLKLKGNLLQKVTTQMFPELPSLEMLTLSYNLIDELDLEGIKKVAPKLITVEVVGLTLKQSAPSGVNFVKRL